ncbi:MAG: hypothetical protein K2H09_05020, partial [Treponemataceae bacterium]|nr:hypothetical protein [Treponemataceae bacterium]
MRINRIWAAALALSMPLASGAFAQEFDDFGGFDDGGDVGGFSDGATAEKPFSIGGEAKFQPRLYVADVDEDSFGWKSLLIDPSLKLNLSYETSSVEFEGKLAVDKDIVMNWREDILNELTMRVYLGNFVLEAGKEKVVWGKGDKLHVLDLFNANDYTDFIVPDYIDRRLAEPMLRAVWNSPFSNNLRVEAVWTPTMTPDRFGTGRWTPASVGALTDEVTALGGGIVAGKLFEIDSYAVDGRESNKKMTEAVSKFMQENGIMDPESVKVAAF